MFDSRRRAVAGAVAIGLMVPATAMAATITGTDANERLKGTKEPDQIDGGAGRDRIFGRAGEDTLVGGLGRDRIFGGSGDDKLFGGDSRDRIFGGRGDDESHGENGRDRMVGGKGDDVQFGGGGNDVIFANRGVDTSVGGAGNDTLWALSRKDVTPGPDGEVDQVGDTLDGGEGNDRFLTRDGEVDRITCGEGRDRAFLDEIDVITDATVEDPNGSCEKVRRGAPKAKDSRSEDRQESPREERARR